MFGHDLTLGNSPTEERDIALSRLNRSRRSLQRLLPAPTPLALACARPGPQSGLSHS